MGLLRLFAVAFGILLGVTLLMLLALSYTVGISLYLPLYLFVGFLAVLAWVAYVYSRKEGRLFGVKNAYVMFALVSVGLLASVLIVEGVAFSPRSNALIGVSIGFLDVKDPNTLVTLRAIWNRGFRLLRLFLGSWWTFSSDDIASRYNFIYQARGVGFKIYVIVNQRIDVQMELTLPDDLAGLKNCVMSFGGLVDYWQIFNEIDDMVKPDGMLYMATEIRDMAQTIHDTIAAGSDGKYVMTFTQAFPWRLDIFSPTMNWGFIDYFGLDVYEQGQSMSIYQVNYLRSISGKPIIVSELGSSNQNPNGKASFIKNAATFFQKNGVPIIVVFEWSNSIYAVKDTTLSFP
jgi:hypothetical protein